MHTNRPRRTIKSENPDELPIEQLSAGEVIYLALEQEGPMTMPRLESSLGLGHATTYTAMRKLLNTGSVEKYTCTECKNMDVYRIAKQTT